LVPIMHWGVRHHFRELEGEDRRLQNPGWEGYYIQTALQSIDFRLDSEGAGVASSVLIEAKSEKRPASPRYFFLNRPFLIVMKKRDSANPFFVMWVENAELLSR
jgi:hypothetical protein